MIRMIVRAWAASVIVAAWLGAGTAAASTACGGLLEPQCPQAAAPTPATPVPPPPPGRVTVALFGDSVTQSIMIPDFVQDGLGGQLQDQLTSLGFQPGGLGFVPAAPYQFSFNADELLDEQPTPTGGWATVGYGKAIAQDGPSGYSAITPWPQATASLSVPNPDVDVLYTSTSSDCPFTVTAGAESWSIDTYLPGPPVAAQVAITLPVSGAVLTVHGPSCGQLTFDGIVAEQPVAPGAVQIEIDNLGHAGHLPWADFQPRVREALIEQRYDLSVFMWGYIAELLADRATIAPYLGVMEARAKIARMNGGSCLIVQPAPIAVSTASVALVKREDETVAAREGCMYTTVLAHLWPNAGWAEQHGLLLVDGVHPTAAGYTEIARALAPVVASLVRGRPSRSSACAASLPGSPQSPPVGCVPAPLRYSPGTGVL